MGERKETAESYVEKLKYHPQLTAYPSDEFQAFLSQSKLVGIYDPGVSCIILQGKRVVSSPLLDPYTNTHTHFQLFMDWAQVTEQYTINTTSQVDQQVT